MFENTVKSAVFPVIWEVLNAVDHELIGVEDRLAKVIAESNDDITSVLAKQQAKMLEVWRPMIENLVNDLHQQHKEVHGIAPPKIRRPEPKRRGGSRGQNT
jgi:hypothetical protein